MQGTPTFEVPGPWKGHLSLAPRPRGGDWLRDEMSGWAERGIGVVLSFLTSEEEQELRLESESKEAERAGMQFVSLPIHDRGIPSSGHAFGRTLRDVEQYLMEGRDVVVHCRMGIGRSGLFAAALLTAAGLDPDEAILRVSHARGLQIPDTPEQVEYLRRFSGSLTAK